MILDEKKLNEALKKQKITRYVLCERAGVSSRTMAKVAKGEDLRPSVVERIAAALGVTAEDLTKQNEILLRLQREQRTKLPGGLYHETQVRLTYNSNHIEGTRLTEDQTRFIFETKTIGALSKDLPIDDVLETVNHFRCIDHVIAHACDPLTDEYVLGLNSLLKAGTTFAAEYGAGIYKRLPNTVGGMETTAPQEVASEMRALLTRYEGIKKPTFEDIVAFHYEFERIHPFQDGNGRVGRLILFKECLRFGYVPTYIDDHYKPEYYNGLRMWKSERGFLVETCRLGQDLYKRLLDYFSVPYND